LIFYPEDTKATILSGADESTGNAYEDLYICGRRKRYNHIRIESNNEYK
jgi:hypothetical protein